jgi:membrane protein implicated in regulation of membrane protease activity
MPTCLGGRVWLHVLYLVCIAEAAGLAGLLFAAVIESGTSLSPASRQLCAAVALVLSVASCYAIYSWLGAIVGRRNRLNL